MISQKSSDGGRLRSDMPEKIEAGTPVQGKVSFGGDPDEAKITEGHKTGLRAGVRSSKAAYAPVNVTWQSSTLADFPPQT